MALTHTTDHAAQALGRLLPFLRDKPKREAFYDVISAQVQALEDALDQLNTKRSLGSSVGAQLDNLGRIVGQPRNGQIDADYLVYLQARIKELKAHGEPEEIYAIFRLLTLSTTHLNQRQEWPAGFTLILDGEAITSTKAALFFNVLQAVTVAGVRSLLDYSQSVGSSTFHFDVGPGFDTGHLAGTIAP